MSATFYEGAAFGMTVAFLLDMVNPKKGQKRSLLWKAIPFVTIIILWFKQRQYEIERKADEKKDDREQARSNVSSSLASLKRLIREEETARN